MESVRKYMMSVISIVSPGVGKDMNQFDPTAERIIIVIFGASGDLTHRKLVPALHSMKCEGALSKATDIIGIARSSLSDESFREQLYGGVEEYSRLDPTVCEQWPNFSDRISYLAGSYDDPETYHRLEERLMQLDPEFGIRTPPARCHLW